MDGSLISPPTLTINRHPVLIDGTTQVALDLQPGESLYALLHRHIDDLNDHAVAVSIGGKQVPMHLWHKVFPKVGHSVAIRFLLQKGALIIVALIALTVFTMGAATGVAAIAAGGAATGVGAGLAAGLAAAGMSAAASMAVVGAIQVVGAMLINKVLGPKAPGTPRVNRDSVFNVGGTQNTIRPYEPFALLFGRYLIAPDMMTLPYNFYEDNDQYVAQVLTPGINVDRFEPLKLGETLLSTYQGVQTWTAGMPGMPEQTIPLFTNVDSVAGAELTAEFGIPGPWVQRTTPLNTIRIQVDVSYLLFDLTSKGKEKNNQEQIEIQYAKVGSGVWLPFGTFLLQNKTQKGQRKTFTFDVAEDQYEVRVRRRGINTDGSGATAEFSLTAMFFVQADKADYSGISRIGLQIKATGQLQGSPSQIRTIAYAKTMPYWNGNNFIAATYENGGLSNPGAQLLLYARGIRNDAGELQAGMGLPDNMIDIESIKAFTTHCRINNFTFNKLLSSAMTHGDVCDMLTLAGMGAWTWAPGKFTAVWVAEGQAVQGVATMANIKKGEFQIDYSLMQAADGIEYSYIDETTWETKTLRVPLPGVTTMENPARLSGDGIGREEHAVMLARYHLAQNLYQFKDIVYSQDLEHMSVSLMSMVALSHDLTKWGHSGRLMEATIVGGVVTLTLEETVPPPPSVDDAYMALRIVGEASYRIFKVEMFNTPSDVIRLVDPWPADAAFPGATGNNPAHDCIYIYDFKPTPGTRARVIGISPTEGLKGASISVVQESDEFWTFVKTGQYIPPKPDSSVRPVPTVSNLQVVEERIVQGDTVFSRLNATWLANSYVSYFVVTSTGPDGITTEVSRQGVINVSWRVDQVGAHTVVVRPYSDDNKPGNAAVFALNVRGADLPPVLVDEFAVIDIGGGLRKYSWGFNSQTIQSPDMAGVEIRYARDDVPLDWANFTPLGDDGFHTSAFESALPVEGLWTIACRSRNTSGTLSDDAFVIVKTLGKNVGEEVNLIKDNITQETIDRFNGDAAAVLEAVTKAGQYTDAQVAALNGILEDIVGANEWNATDTYPVGDFVVHNNVMYRALVENTNVEPGTDSGVTWQAIGDYTSVGDALAAAISMSTTNASDITVQSQRIDAVVARMPVGNGAVASQASVATLQQALIDESTVRAQQIEAVQASLADKADASAVQLLESSVEDLEGQVTAQGQAITNVQAKLGGTVGINRLRNASFLNMSTAAWDGGATPLAVQWSERLGGYHIYNIAGTGRRYIASELVANGDNTALPGEVSTLAMSVNCDGNWSIAIQYRNQAGALLQEYESQTYPSTASEPSSWRRVELTSGQAPAGTVFVVAVLWATNSVVHMRLALPMLALGPVVGPFVDGKSPVYQAQALTTQTAKVTSLEASAAVTSAAIARLGGGGNLLQTTVFGLGLGLSPWFLRGTAGSWQIADNILQDSRVPPGMKALVFYANAVQAAGSYVYYAQSIPVERGKKYVASAYVLPYQVNTELQVIFVDANGNQTGATSYSPVTSAYTPNGNISGYTRLQVLTIAAPADAVTVWFNFVMSKTSAAGNDAAMWALQPMIEQASDSQTQASPWVSGANPATTASAITTLSVNINATTGKVNAVNGVYLDVNGYVSGTVSENNGVRSSFTIMASLFKVVDPSGGGRTEFGDGNWRVYHDNGTLILRMGKW